MKKPIIALISFCLFIINLNGQSSLPPVYDIINDTVIHTDIPGEYWKMLEDKKGKLTLQQVIQSPVADEFHLSQSKDIRYNYAIHAYWFCYRLRNAMNHDIEIGLGYENLEDQANEESTFYLKRDGKWSIFENGLLTPHVKLNGLDLNNYIPVRLGPGEELIVYNRVYNSYLFQFFSGRHSIYFSTPKKILEKNYVRDESLYVTAVNDSTLFGILLSACIINFFFFLIVRERVYLFFALYVLCLGFGRMPIETYFVFLRGSRVFWGWIYDITFNMIFFLLVYFIRSLLNTQKILPRWDRILKRLNYTYLTFFLFNNFSPYLFSSVIDRHANKIISYFTWGLAIILMICILLTFGIFLKRRDSSNKILIRLILPAFSIWGVFWIISILHDLFGLILFPSSFYDWLNIWWEYIESVCLCWLVFCYSWILLQRFRKLQNRIAEQAVEKEKEKTALIEQKKIELETTVEERTAELKHSLENLQSTQNQLIQSEKMASLGELTAGIAHEIQNPLNFVNNFSDVNRELIEEASQAIKAGKTNDAFELLTSIRNNEEKISTHGKRADSIVKGMLQHSHNRTGQKELTDFNALANEYLRLSYHGARAKDKSFNVDMQTDFDPAVGQINIAAQDMSRVMLNLYNNAFYAVREKMKEQIPGYRPTVSVSTKRDSDHIKIIVSDNGTGVPQKVIDKIFQPFFTTKPAGQGTGLGLSISYDIIKAHGGKLKVESKEGEGAEFEILIPAI
jgi:signal transduction histidine kinase